MGFLRKLLLTFCNFSLLLAAARGTLDPITGDQTSIYQSATVGDVVVKFHCEGTKKHR